MLFIYIYTYICLNKVNDVKKIPWLSLQNKYDGTYAIGKKNSKNYGTMQLTAKQATA